MPHRMIFVDTETELFPLGRTRTGKMQFEQVFRMGMAAYVRRDNRNDKFFAPRWFPFYSEIFYPDQSAHTADFWQWVDSCSLGQTKLFMFMHNAGFDIPVLKAFENLMALGWYLTQFIIDDPPTMLKFENCPLQCGMSSGASWRQESKCGAQHRVIVILDTLNYFRMSLKALGESIGSYKLEMPVKPGTFDDSVEKWLSDSTEFQGMPDWTVSLETWEEYNKQDVQILIDAMRQYMDFIKLHDLGPFQMTQASQSFTAYRHRFMQKESVLIDDDEKALATARKAYSGGRVEAYAKVHIEGETTYKLDINSMYPFVMQAKTFPSVLRSHWKNVSIEEYETKIRPNYKACAYVKVDTDEPVYPKRMDGKLVFPVGRFFTYLSTPEIDYALDHGHLKEFIHVAFYQHAPLFKSFVDYFYTLRLAAKKRGDEKESFFLKILMNSLYGKFGQNGKKWENVEEDSIQVDESQPFDIWATIHHDSQQIDHYRRIGKLVQRLAALEESRESHPAIAAHITAEARIYLWQIIKQAGKENVYYCDTDSVFVNRDGRDALNDLIDPARLGALKVEGESKLLIINGPKDYRFGNTVVLKGVKYRHKPVETNVYRFETFRGLRGALREHDLNRMIITRGLKRLRRIYEKGTVNADGSITPFALDEAEKEPLYEEAETQRIL